MRTIDSATQAEIDSGSFNIATLISLYGIGGEDIFFTDAPEDVSYSSTTWTSTRLPLGISEVKEDEDLKIESVDISLSAIDSENVKLFLDYDYIDRRVVIHKAIITDSSTIVGAPIIIFDGRLDQPRVTENFSARKADLAISASSHWSNFDEAAGRHTNKTEQNILYPGDTFFDFTTETQKDVKWGKE